MRRLVWIVLLLIATTGVQAQASTPKPGDPPVLAKITISPSADQGSVTISGSSGAVFANAYLSIRNLYTDATAYTQAGVTGNFTTSIAGTDDTPFWISPSSQRLIPEGQTPPAFTTGSLPGGPGVIVYRLSHTAPATPPATQIAIDGDLSDWNTYPDAKHFDKGTRAVYALWNLNSLYVAFSGSYVTTAYTKLQLRFTIDLDSYTLTFDPRQARPADLVMVNPAQRDLGTLIVAAQQASDIELRIPLSFVERPAQVSLDSVSWLNADGKQISADTIDASLKQQQADDGILHPTISGSPTPFALSGALGENGDTWSIQGQAAGQSFLPGDTLNIQMSVDYGSSDVASDTQMIGVLALQPIARSADGKVHLVGGISTNNGWSTMLTPSGMPIDNLDSSVTLGEATAQPYQMIRGADDVRFPLDFSVMIPADLPSGLYVPLFKGYTQPAKANRVAWDSGLPARLPLILNIGAVHNVRLLWTLFADDPSSGSRGILPDEDRSYAALSNRVRFDSPTYILQPFKPGTTEPIGYPLEPYLLDELSNSYTDSSAPLIPFVFPAGQLRAKVTLPDGTVDDLGSTEIAQNQLSTAAQDERTLFGAQSPIDEFRLSTLNPKFSAYKFTHYGDYRITLMGSLQDAFGNQYQGGGTYHVVAAEPLDLIPGALSGTPFEVGDSLNFGLHLSPGVPADITEVVTVYPLDSIAPITQKITGKANSNGYFQPTTPFVFNTPGEYIIDYEARYTDAANRLWAASLRSAGVIASPDSTIVAHGARGLPDVISDQRPAWFSLPQYEQSANVNPDPVTLNFPYHSGDIEWVDDGSGNLIRSVIRVQELGVQDFARWLTSTLPNYVSDNHIALAQLANQGEMPVAMIGQGGDSAALHPDQIASDSYSYVSAVRPNVTVRQYVSGGEDGGLPLRWDEDDPLNRQIGAGSNGNAPNDVIFLFGGAVIREAKVRDTAIYGALAVVTDNDTPRIYPPDRGSAGGPDGGPLLTINNQPVDMFIDMTGVQPGERLMVGDTVAVAGQVAPTIAATVTTTFTSPSGKVTRFTSQANAIGYDFDPASQFTVDEPGVWSVGVHVEEMGVTSAGTIMPPAPEGSVLGAQNEQFSIYVLPQNSTPLAWNPLLMDTIIPIVSPYNFSFTLPSDWKQIQVYHTLTTPGLIIEDGQIHANGRSFSYTYSEPLQNRAFPNLETDGRSGLYLSDVRTLTFVATGVDASGKQQIRSRTFTLMHDRLITTE